MNYYIVNSFPGIFIITAIICMLFSFLTILFFGIWIYKDCKLRGESPLIWLLILIFVSNFIGVIIYLVVRKEKKICCNNCGYFISTTAKYCENCGQTIKSNNEDILEKEKSNRKYIVLGVISICGVVISIVISIIVGIISITNSMSYPTSITSNKSIWNTGIEISSKQKRTKTSWNLDLTSATKGFVKEHKMEINNPEKDILYLDATCELKEEDGNLMLWLVQDDIVKSINVTNLGETLEYPLKEFKEGKIFVRLQINDVKNVKSSIVIK